MTTLHSPKIILFHSTHSHLSPLSPFSPLSLSLPLSPPLTFPLFPHSTELKMTEWKTTVHILSSSQSSIAAQQKIVLADGSLCSRQQSGGGEGVAISGQFGSQGALPLCCLSEYYVWITQGYASGGSRTIILYSRQSNNNEQCRQQQDTSQAAMLADGEWQPVAAQAGAVVLPPVVVQVLFSGFN